MPLFSIIIPTFNRKELLARALDSVWSQTFTDYEVIVVDDGSSDGTWGYIQSLGSKVVALKQENAGPGAARNAACKVAIGDYLCFLDSDDLLFAWTLEVYASIVGKSKQIGILLGSVRRFRSEEELDFERDPKVAYRTLKNPLEALAIPIFFGTGYAVIRRSDFLACGGIDTGIRVFEDQDLGLRLGEILGCAVIESPLCVAYRDSPGSLTTDLASTIEGVRHLVNCERNELYPGGTANERVRRKYISYSVRSVSFQCVGAGCLEDAWKLYCETWGWHFVLIRFRFLLVFPVLIAYSGLKNVFPSILSSRPS